jgi:very-short-patch-repair endonuclease
MYTQPQFYSPLHTPQNWQIPTKRRECLQWLRYFAENEPKVAAALNIYAQFPMNGFETQCEDSKIKRYYDSLNKKLNLDHWCQMISREYFLIGDVFPFLQISCEKCKSTNVLPNGKLCTHPGGTFSRMVCLNPDWVDVQRNQLSDDPVITMIPDDELKRTVFQKRPKALYDALPPHIRQLILSGKPFPLDNRNVSHIMHDETPYGTYGSSLIRRLFKILTYKDKLMTAQWIVAERLILPIRVVKVGSEERPAGPSDIADIQQQLAQTANDPNLTLVTHHNFELDWFGASGKVLTLSNEFEFINKEILQGLMVNEALLSGEAAGYASSAIGAELLISRMESWRQGTLGRWIEEKIYKPVAQMKGFVDEAATEELGEPVWLYPKIKWNDLNIRDDTQQKQIWMQAYDKKIMSAESLCEKLDLHYDQEVERIRLETAQTTIGGPPGGAGGMGGAGGVGGAPPGGLFGGDAGAGGPPPGGPMGAPGDTGMGGTGMGSPVGGAPAAAGSMGKIMTKGHAAKQMKPMAEEAAQPTGVKLTSLEQIMYKLLSEMKYGMRLPFNPWVQYPLGPYRADFAIPQLRLAIECDGFAWHSLPDKKAKDQMRDAQLAKYGWTTVRFSEVDLKENLKEVQKTVAALIYKLWKKAHEDQSKKGKGKVAMTDPAMFKKAETMDTGDFEFMDLAQKYGMVSVPLGVVSMEAIDLMAQEDPYIKPEQRLEAVWGAATTPIVKEAEVKTEAKESSGAQ